MTQSMRLQKEKVASTRYFNRHDSQFKNPLVIWALDELSDAGTAFQDSCVIIYYHASCAEEDRSL
jgi:hypothetical protein